MRNRITRRTLNHVLYGERVMRSVVQSQLAKRQAVQQHKIFVVSREFHGGHDMKARALVSGNYYDVNERNLRALQSGSTPEELGLEPAQESQS